MILSLTLVLIIGVCDAITGPEFGFSFFFASIAGFRNFFLVSVPLYLFVVACAGIWIVRRSLRPLKTLSSRIEGVTHKTLTERIDTTYQAEEIKCLAESFNSMLDRLQRAFDAEKRLIADASHELKTPLSVIKARCDVLLQKDRKHKIVGFFYHFL